MIEQQTYTGINLEDTITALWEARKADSEDGLRNQANSEHYLQEAYTGRYLFELIQNARDAAKAAGIHGEIMIRITDEKLSIINNGRGFDGEGIRGVTLIGASSKGSGEFIGFKGIGFKSVQDVSDTPKVVTAYGSILFDRERSFEFLRDRFETKEDLPLFFLPHFDQERLTAAELNNGMVTRIDLPLKKGITATEIIKSFTDKILRSTILLLGSIKKITFESSEKTVVFEITPKPTHKIQVSLNGSPFTYKVFKPDHKARIPSEILNQLSPKEAAVYGKDPFVDISVALRCDEKNHLVKLKECKLYLYFPLKINSGFPFIIHSHFIVDPQRSSLRPGPLNEFIAGEIGKYLGRDWLKALKKDHAGSVLKFLAFKRNDDEPILKILYKALVEQLKPQAFIYDSESRRLFRAEDIMVAGEADRKLFPGNRLNDKTLIYIEDQHISQWLIEEFNVEVLRTAHIHKHIEEECQRQAKRGAVKYFSDLYGYVASRKDVNLRECRVLIDEELRLFKGSDYVFNGMERTEDVRLSKVILKHIHIAHPGVRNSFPREIQERLGFTEYGRDALVRRLIELYALKNPPYRDILVALLSTGSSLTGLIRRNLRVPVMLAGKIQWVTTLTTPVYADSSEVRTAYPNALFLDVKSLQNGHVDAESILKDLAELGVWNKPAMYFREGTRRVYEGEQSYRAAQSALGKSTDYYEISGDWMIDKPSVLTLWFTQSIIENWTVYRAITEDTDGLRIRFQSHRSGFLNYPKELIFDTSSFSEYFLSSNWVVTEQGPSALHDVIFGGPGDKGQRISQLRNYFRVITLDYFRYERFIRDTIALHLDLPSFANYRNILRAIHRLHPNVSRMPELFRKAYHIVLNKLFDHYASSGPQRDVEILKFRAISFLCRTGQDEEFGWEKGSEIYFVENRIAFEAYPQAVQKVIQPQFTLMDKTRFGQVARRIGMNYRDHIQEELLPYKIEQEIPLTNYIRNFSECLALLEAKSETQLIKPEIASSLATLVVLKCKEITVEFYHRETKLDSYHPQYKVIAGKKVPTILVSEPLLENEYHFFAGLVCSVINELQDKDMQVYEGSLQDFFLSPDGRGYLKRNHVDPYRIEEINDLLQDFVLNEKQSFWEAVCRVRVGFGSIDWSIPHDNIRQIADHLQIRESLIKEIEEELDFSNMSSGKNIPVYLRLLNALNIDFPAFRQRSLLALSFLLHHQQQFDAYRQSLKATFEHDLYQHLLKNSEKDQEKFAQILFDYDRAVYNGGDGLQSDVKKLLRQYVIRLFPKLKFTFEKNAKATGFIATIYNQNFQALTKTLSMQKADLSELNRFLLSNKERSLIYFGRHTEAANRYILWLDNLRQQRGVQTNRNSTGIDLSGYLNKSGTTIHIAETVSVPLPEKQDPNASSKRGGGGGRRFDADISQQNNLLIGLVAEYMVYLSLKDQQVSDLDWNSANAATAGINREGRDDKKYDMTYCLDDETPQYIEVKGTSGGESAFFISSNEVEFAKSKMENYHLVFVRYALDNDRRVIVDLGNPFHIASDETLLYNSRYTAVYDTLRIVFDITETFNSQT